MGVLVGQPSGKLSVTNIPQDKLWAVALSETLCTIVEFT